jgi:uncharacterized protein (TIGR03437 family)
VSKWDARGNELWTRDLGTPGPPASHPELIAAGDLTGFYVAGGHGGSAFVRKYDAGGNELWSRPAAASHSSLYLSGLVADASGVYIAGLTPLTSLMGQCRSGSGGDSFVRKFDPGGNEVWTREFGTSDAAWSSGVAVDGTGVYVVGRDGTAQVAEALYLSDVFSPVNGASGAFLAKLDKSLAVVTDSRPRIISDCVVNAASYVGGGVAPGEVVTVFGSAMGPAEVTGLRLADNGRLATTLADTRILFNGVPAPLLYVSEKQSSAIVPYGAADGTSVQVQVEYKGVQSDPVTMPVLASRPGIFSLDGSGQGQGAILNEDGTLNSPSNPAPRGSIITIFGTGGGEAAPGVVDGQIVSDIVRSTRLPVSVFLDDGTLDGEFYAPPQRLEVLYAGSSRGSVAGLLQVNVRVPAKAPGEKAAHATLTLFIGSQWTFNQATVALR